MAQPDTPIAGCVLFTSHAHPGPGWASIGGQSAQRIQSVDELDGDILWVTNLAYLDIPSEHVLERLRRSNFMGPSIHLLAADFDMDIVDNPIESAELIGELFNRVCRLTCVAYDIDDVFKFESTLVKTIAAQLLTPTMDSALPADVSSAVGGSFLFSQRCAGEIRPGSAPTSFFWPEQIHASNVMSFPIPKGEWHHKTKGFPSSASGTQDFIFDVGSQASALVRVGVDQVAPKIAALTEFGAPDRAARDWITLPEAAHLSLHANIQVHEMWVSDSFVIPSQQPRWRIPDFGPTGAFSISSNLIAGAHWQALASGQRVSSQRGIRHRQSPRGTVMRGWDRMLCLCGAIDFTAAGIHVFSYGQGGVNVTGNPSDLVHASHLAANNEMTTHLALLRQFTRNSSDHTTDGDTSTLSSSFEPSQLSLAKNARKHIKRYLDKRVPSLTRHQSSLRRALSTQDVDFLLAIDRLLDLPSFDQQFSSLRDLIPDLPRASAASNGAGLFDGIQRGRPNKNEES